MRVRRGLTEALFKTDEVDKQALVGEKMTFIRDCKADGTPEEDVQYIINLPPKVTDQKSLHVETLRPVREIMGQA